MMKPVIAHSGLYKAEITKKKKDIYAVNYTINYGKLLLTINCFLTIVLCLHRKEKDKFCSEKKKLHSNKLSKRENINFNFMWQIQRF